MNGLALSTDFYELTMMAGYYAAGLMAPATFELSVRELPINRSFLIAAGLEQALEYLEHLRFGKEDIEHLRHLPGLQRVGPAFFEEYLPRFRFTGEVWAVHEGTPIFPPEPLLRVTAPLPEAQLVETALLAHIAFQTSVASRAARVVEAASGRPVVEFGARRAHGLDAGVLAARAAFLAGCESTSNIEAGRRFGIAGLRHHGALVGDGVPGRDLRISSVCRGLRRPHGHPPGYVRHGGCRPINCRQLSEAARGETRQRRHHRPEQERTGDPRLSRSA